MKIEKQFSGEDTRKISIFYPSELKKLQSRVHTDGQLWLMDDLLRRIIAFMPEKQDYHCEWHGGGVYYGALEWMLRLRPQYQTDFLQKRKKFVWNTCFWKGFTGLYWKLVIIFMVWGDIMCMETGFNRWT